MGQRRRAEKAGRKIFEILARYGRLPRSNDSVQYDSLYFRFLDAGGDEPFFDDGLDWLISQGYLEEGEGFIIRNESTDYNPDQLP